MIKFWIGALIFLPLNAFCFEAPVEGVVVKVLEGDALVVRDATHRKHMIRLIAVNAPESVQAYCEKARESLSRLVLGRRVVVEWSAYEKGCQHPQGAGCHKLGKVLLNGEDINLRQLELGYAWHDKRYLDQQSTPDRSRYNEAEEKAREKKVGLWKQSSPLAPWDAKKVEERQPSSQKRSRHHHKPKRKKHH